MIEVIGTGVKGAQALEISDRAKTAAAEEIEIAVGEQTHPISAGMQGKAFGTIPAVSGLMQPTQPSAKRLHVLNIAVELLPLGGALAQAVPPTPAGIDRRRAPTQTPHAAAAMGEGFPEHSLLLAAVGPQRDVPSPGIADGTKKHRPAVELSLAGFVVLTPLLTGNHQGQKLADMGASRLGQLHIDQAIGDEHPQPDRGRSSLPIAGMMGKPQPSAPEPGNAAV